MEKEVEKEVEEEQEKEEVASLRRSKAKVIK